MTVSQLAKYDLLVFLYSRGIVQNRGFQIFFFLNKAEEYLFQMKFKVEVNCKTDEQNQSCSGKKVAFPSQPLIFPCFSGWILEALGLCRSEFEKPPSQNILQVLLWTITHHSGNSLQYIFGNRGLSRLR